MSAEESYDTCADCQGDLLAEAGHTDHYGPRMTGEWSAREQTEWSYRNGVVQWNPGERRHHTGACDSRAPSAAEERLLDPGPDDLHTLAWKEAVRLDKFDAGVRLAQPPADPDPELTLYREVTGRPVFSRTHAGWLAEYLATGLDLPKERMLALVTEQQHDYLLDGPAVQPASRAYHAPGTRRQQRRARAARGEIMAAWTGWPRQALTWWQELPGPWKGVLLFVTGYVLFIATIVALALATA